MYNNSIGATDIPVTAKMLIVNYRMIHKLNLIGYFLRC